MNDTTPLVGIIMGSDSDLPTMQAAIAVCEDFAVPHEVAIVSAHRTPDRMMNYAREASQRGLKVIIAGAGGAAHLPGMVASLTPLPVIGVPVTTRHLQGVDSLYSIVQMPRGIPVATVAIGNAQNAGLLAVQILAIHQPELLEKVRQYRQNLTQTVLDKQQKLEEIGYKKYLDVD
ncbi:MAG: 5-(carboxyamino)imidazole ribonucleotide mutase [Cyanobacteria bacterium P01_E01_bin.42]